MVDTERPFFILALKGKVFWPRMYKKTEIMEKPDNNQLELFTEAKSFGRAKIKSSRPKRSFFTSIWNYEKVILSVISIIAASVISFCLGVEHGKRVSFVKYNSRFDISSKIKTPDAALIASQKIQKHGLVNHPAAVTETKKSSEAVRIVTTPALPQEKYNAAIPVEPLDLKAKAPSRAESIKMHSSRGLKPGDSCEGLNEKQPAGGYTIQLASYKTKEYAQRAAKLLKKKGVNPLILTKGNYTILCVGNFTDKNAAQSKMVEFKKQYQSCYIRRL